MMCTDREFLAYITSLFEIYGVHDVEVDVHGEGAVAGDLGLAFWDAAEVTADGVGGERGDW